MSPSYGQPVFESGLPGKVHQYMSIGARFRCVQPLATCHNNKKYHTSTIRKFYRVGKYMNLDTSIIIEGVYKSIQLKSYGPYVKNLTKLTKALKPNAELIVKKCLITLNQCFINLVQQPLTTHPTLVPDSFITGLLGPTNQPAASYFSEVVEPTHHIHHMVDTPILLLPEVHVQPMINPLYELVSKQKLKRLNREAILCRKIIKFNKRRQCKSTN